jgi:hypothetical protein
MTAGPRPALAALFLFALTAAARADDFEKEPINYATAPADNVVSRLQRRLDAGQAALKHEDHFGYLRSLLRELRVPESSQTLVFSKTSLQRQRIAPATPRALYFSDEVYVGFCQHGDLLEVSAADPQLGAVYYSLPQQPADKPRFVRQNDSCLICHGSSLTRGIPGHLVRSVFADAEGYPILSAGTYRTDHSSPLKERWGGWYVTGTSGPQAHLGNLVFRDEKDAERPDPAAGRNLTDLSGRVKTSAYLTPHSDLVALLVLEHQAEMHNRITRANFEARLALHQEAALNRELGRPATERWDSTTSRIKSAAEPLVQYLLFADEAPLTAPVAGTSKFAEEFSRQGPRDRRGRSLRDLDLKRRLFAYPCSYLIYSAAFDALPGPVTEYVYRRLYDVLTGKDTTPAFAHLAAADRAALLEILRETKPGLPEYWKVKP